MRSKRITPLQAASDHIRNRRDPDYLRKTWISNTIRKSPIANLVYAWLLISAKERFLALSETSLDILPETGFWHF